MQTTIAMTTTPATTTIQKETYHAVSQAVMLGITRWTTTIGANGVVDHVAGRAHIFIGCTNVAGLARGVDVIGFIHVRSSS